MYGNVLKYNTSLHPTTHLLEFISHLQILPMASCFTWKEPQRHFADAATSDRGWQQRSQKQFHVQSWRLITFPRCCWLPGEDFFFFFYSRTWKRRWLCVPWAQTVLWNGTRVLKGAISGSLRWNGVSLCLTTWMDLICVISMSSEQWSNQR